MFALSCAAYGLLSVSAVHPPFHPVRALDYFDLKVYRGGAQSILHGAPLYETKIMGFYFTYPPLAAVAFLPLAAVSLTIDEIVVTAVNGAALIALLWCALRLPSSRSLPSQEHPAPRDASAWPLVVFAAAALLWLEPVTTALAYGQIDLVLAALVVYDLSRADCARTKGAVIGFAAGVKLTPLIFVPYLMLTRRWRAASLASAVFGATVALGYALLPSDSVRYWSGLFLDSSRVSLPNAGAAPANQSLRGAILRLAPASGIDPIWILAAATVAAVGLSLAVLASRRGDEATGFSICALTGLLVSPVSWTHHWVLVVPALLLLGHSAYQRRSRLSLAALAAIVLLGCTYPTWLVAQRQARGVHLTPAELVAADPYVIIGLAALGLGALAQSRLLRPRDTPV
ncbi:MAG: DUF2029 domain-containing protein [Chloroflexi bacterium]|nr:DUF2029 domain-containing protein [Chloroflexota bacterium]